MTIIHAENRFNQKKKVVDILKKEEPQERSKASYDQGSSKPPTQENSKGFVPFKFLGDLLKTVSHQWVVMDQELLPDPFPPEPQEPGPLVA